MARQTRQDTAGSVHHVTNRGVGRRAIFENRLDRRCFLDHVVHAVTRGEIDLIAFCVMSTHFHLLVRSLEGRLDVAMRRIQTAYSTYFNQRTARDGALVKGRYFSRLVDDDAYFNAVVDYIHLNPVQAGICARAREYEFSSAFHLASQKTPTWLVSRSIRDDEPVPADFAFVAHVVESRIGRPYHSDPLSELMGAGSEGLLAWMRRKAAAADGTRAGLPVTTPSAVMGAIERMDPEIAILAEPLRMRRETPRVLIASGVLHELAGLPTREIAPLIQRDTSRAGQAVRRHRRLMAESDAYAGVARDVAASALLDNPPAFRPKLLVSV